jgi:hypothetical protein
MTVFEVKFAIPIVCRSKAKGISITDSKGTYSKSPSYAPETSPDTQTPSMALVILLPNWVSVDFGAKDALMPDANIWAFGLHSTLRRTCQPSRSQSTSSPTRAHALTPPTSSVSGQPLHLAVSGPQCHLANVSLLSLLQSPSPPPPCTPSTATTHQATSAAALARPHRECDASCLPRLLYGSELSQLYIVVHGFTCSSLVACCLAISGTPPRE